MLCCRVLQKDIIQCDEQQVAVLFYFKEFRYKWMAVSFGQILMLLHKCIVT